MPMSRPALASSAWTPAPNSTTSCVRGIISNLARSFLAEDSLPESLVTEIWGVDAKQILVHGNDRERGKGALLIDCLREPDCARIGVHKINNKCRVKEAQRFSSLLVPSMSSPPPWRGEAPRVSSPPC